MGIAMALPGFNDLGRLVTLFFQKQIYLKLTEWTKMNGKSMWKVKKI